MQCATHAGMTERVRAASGVHCESTHERTSKSVSPHGSALTVRGFTRASCAVLRILVMVSNVVMKFQRCMSFGSSTSCNNIHITSQCGVRYLHATSYVGIYCWTVQARADCFKRKELYAHERGEKRR